jgi:nucleoside 2-deoxyribosyltransferase
MPGKAAKSIYLASPLGFTEEGRSYLAQTLLPKLLGRGFDVLDPWEDETGETGRLLNEATSLPTGQRRGALAQVNERIGRRNVTLLDRCDGVLALLNGPDVDSGTASEIGYASALQRPIVGWRDDLRSSGENEATAVNLQVAHFIAHSGGTIVESFDAAVDALASALARSTTH